MAKNYYNESSPFLVRKPLVNLWQMMLFGIFMTTAIFGAIYFGNQYLRDFTIILFGILIVILLYYINNTYYDEKTANEFQASVYSGAMRCNTYLTFILYQDVSIYYFDQRYAQQIAGAASNHHIDNILETLDIETAERGRIIAAVQDLEPYVSTPHTFFDGQKRVQVVLRLTPLSRPRGFLSFTLEKLD